MYFWKCWRDTRTRFIFFLILVSGNLVFSLTIIVARPGGFGDFERGGPLSDVAHLWSWVATAVLGVFVPSLLCLQAWMLAPSSIGEEYKEQTLGFLFTRPRSRRYLVWTCWSVGACELLGWLLPASLGPSEHSLACRATFTRGDCWRLLCLCSWARWRYTA